MEVVGERELLRDLAGAVGGVAVDDEDFEAVAGVVLRGEAAEAGLDEALLVAHRDKD